MRVRLPPPAIAAARRGRPEAAISLDFRAFSAIAWPPFRLADEAIEPAVAGSASLTASGLGRLGPPFVNRPALARGDDVGFGVGNPASPLAMPGDVPGKEPVLLSSTTLGPGGLLACSEPR